MPAQCEAEVEESGDGLERKESSRGGCGWEGEGKREGRK